jgi:hypothetical protein
MKKPILAALFVVAIVFSTEAQVPSQPKPEDVAKNLILVEKLQSVPEAMKSGFETISAKDSIAMLSYLSSDLMEGRETGTRGYQLAAEYAASLMALWKVKPAGDVPQRAFSGQMAPGGPAQTPQVEKSFLQEFALQETTETSTQMSLEVRKGEAVRTRSFQQALDYMSMSSTGESVSAPVVFAGYGISEKEIGYDDFKNLDVKGKIVLVISEGPGKENPNSPFQQKKELKEKYFPQTPAAAFARPAGGGFNKTLEIAKLGPAAILQVQNTGKDADMFKRMSAIRRPNDDRPIINRPRRRLAIPGSSRSMPGGGSPVIRITRQMANALLEVSGQKLEDLQKKIETTGKPASMDLPGTKLTIQTTVKSQLIRAANVVGYVEGSDPTLKDEVVVVGAHLDHMGKWEDYVFNGADDNGSGSVGVLNIARAIATSPQKPKRTVVFCLWTGEEQGLLGSRYYVANPAFPLAKTVTYLNMDTISRPYDERKIASSEMFNFPGGQDLLKKVKPANFLPVSYSMGAGFADVLRAVNQHVGLDLFLRESAGQEWGGGSDHFSFGAEKISWIFTTAAVTEDYHQTSDSVEKISGDLIEKISKLMYSVAYILADK